MSSAEWKTIPLSDIVDIIGGGTPKTSNPDYWNGEIPWISIVDFGNGKKFIWDTEKKITQSGLENSSTRILHKGQIVISARGTVGEIGVVTKDMAFNQSCYGLNAKDIACNEFLYYLLSFSIHQLKQKTHGSVFETITRDTFNNIHVNLPPLPEQRAIAGVLSALDDKIELNRRMNHTLEQLAQALFKHMFVNNSECEKWDVKTLDYVCGFEYGKALKETSRVSGIIPVYGSNGHIGFHNEFLVKGPGIVVGRKGNPGIVTFVHTDFFPIDTTFYVVPKNNSSFYWLFFTLSDLNLPNLGADSAVPGLNRNIAYMSLVAVPPQDLCYEFENLIKPLFEKIQVNNKETQTLAELRDTLLPKLMSGQVRVKI